MDYPEIIIQGQETELQLHGFEENQLIKVKLGDKIIKGEFENSTYSFPITLEEKSKVVVSVDQTIVSEKELNPIPLWMSLIPPLLAILLALVVREVISALLIGIFSGAVIIFLHSHSFLEGWLFAFMATIDTYILGALNNSGHLSIIVFSLLIGGMVSVISKNGGMQGVVNRISNYANSPKSGQLATWFLGVAIFFDDYANTLIVGNTMRPVTDRLKISREKLAYIVDSTAAPIAAIAFVTTWIGAELGYIESGISKIEGLNEGTYATFINSLAYSFYPIFALLFILMLVLKQRDFGPMYQAEIKARKGELHAHSEGSSSEVDEFQAQEGISHRAYNAIIPVLIVILGTIAGLLYTGWDASVWNDESLAFSRKLSIIIGQADSYQALLWSSMAGLGAAIKLSLFQKLLDLSEAVEAAMTGIKTMLSAISILVLAWALSIVIEDLHTADLLTSIMSDNVSPFLVPALTFILAALVAFSTGSSWGTMAILYPLMLPASWQICQVAGLPYDESLSIFNNVVSCVLAGSVLGDHCSPISDTTILSSLASSCNHIEHVRTQMPYALVVGAVAILAGTIPAAFGLPFWITFPIGICILYLVVHFVGKKTD